MIYQLQKMRRYTISYFFQIYNLSLPNDWESALDLYANLLKLLKRMKIWCDIEKHPLS